MFTREALKHKILYKHKRPNVGFITFKSHGSLSILTLRTHFCLVICFNIPGVVCGLVSVGFRTSQQLLPN